MKKLNRLLLLHWYKYEKEIVEFDNINFLTGKTAAGKSTIIDALQLVLLGDTNGAFFNKAANDKSNRTLKSYLFGENGDNEEGGYRYLRNDRFTSYVALEFEDTVNHKKFVTGFVADCYKDQTFDYKWFIINTQGFPSNFFIDEKREVPYEIKQLRSFLVSWLHSKSAFEFCDTNKRYQEVTMGKFGSVKNKYRTLLRKAVPFTPISDIEKFITESICDVKNDIDVDQMQNDIRQYKSLQRDANQIQKRVTMLNEICEINQKYEGEKEKEQVQRYIVHRAEKEVEQEKEAELKKELQANREKIQANTNLMDSLKKEINTLKLQYDKLNEEYRTSDITRKEKELREQLNRLKEKLDVIEKNISDMTKELQRYGEQWSKGLASIHDIPYITIPASYSQLITQLEKFSWETRECIPIGDCAKRMQEVKEKLQKKAILLKEEWSQLHIKVEQLEGIVRKLKSGIKAFPENVTRLIGVLQKQGIEAKIFANLLEIKEERWRNAIEGYLGNQRFYLIIKPEEYKQAVRIYNEVKKTEQIHEVGIVDIRKLQKENHQKPMRGSLAEMIRSENQYAAAYANYLLGKVIRCDNVDDLNKHHTAITDQVMLYKGYVVRSIHPERYRTPYIGQESLKMQLRMKLQQLEELQEKLNRVGDYYRKLDEVSKLAIMETYQSTVYMELIAGDEEYEQLKEQIAQIQEEYDGLDFLYLERIKKQLNQLEHSLNEKDGQHRDLDKQNVAYQTKNDTINKEKLPDVIGRIAECTTRIDERYNEHWRITIGEPRFQQEVETGKKPDAIITGFNAALGKTAKARESLGKERIEKRTQYNKEFKMSYEVTREDNTRYDEELEELQAIRLPEYVGKIEDAKEKAYNQFRDDFIAKLKSNIETVRQQIDELNNALKQSVFGTDSYRFIMKPRPEYKRYYDMITDQLLMDTGGWNIASQSFNDKYQREIAELFDQLIVIETDVSAQKRAEYEKNVKKFTDYKTYLLFDLKVTDENGNEQSLSKTLLKKSGGETQIPFYISLLASFSQVCRVRNTKQNNTIRLIILDEAFSKMDGERIKECIRLLRKFELQAIFSAPPEKIADIAPLVDRNIAVFKDGEQSFTKHFDPREFMEEETHELSEMAIE